MKGETGTPIELLNFLKRSVEATIKYPTTSHKPTAEKTTAKWQSWHDWVRDMIVEHTNYSLSEAEQE